MKNLGTVIPTSTTIANAYGNVFQNDEPILMLECFAFHFLGPNRSFAILALVIVHSLYSSASIIS